MPPARRVRADYARNTRALELARQIGEWRERLYTIVIPVGGQATEEQERFKAHCLEQIRLIKDELMAVLHGDD